MVLAEGSLTDYRHVADFAESSPDRVVDVCATICSALTDFSTGKLAFLGSLLLLF